MINKVWLLFWCKFIFLIFVIFVPLGVFPNIGEINENKNLVDVFINGTFACSVVLLILLFDKFYFTDKRNHDLNKKYYHIPKYDFFFHNYVSKVITKLTLSSKYKVNFIDLQISSDKYFEVKVGNEIYTANSTPIGYNSIISNLRVFHYQVVEIISETDIFAVINKSNSNDITTLNISTLYFFNNVDFNSLISFIIFCSLSVGFVSALTNWLINYLI